MKKRLGFTIAMAIMLAGCASQPTQEQQTLSDAAWQGDAQAQYDYAQIQDKPSKALSWYWKAANQGHAAAQYEVAKDYRYGYSTKVQPEKALDYFRRAAALGHLPSQLELSQMFAEGVGTTKNLNAARYWLKKAAAQDSQEALAMLEALGA